MEIDPNRKADDEMKSEVENQKETKPFNMFRLFIAILGVLIVIAVIGAYWSSNRATTTTNMGKVTEADTAIVNKSDTLKQ